MLLVAVEVEEAMVLELSDPVVCLESCWACLAWALVDLRSGYER